MHLHPEADAAGVRLIAYESLGSTNADALARARAGERGPLWITAARQTAGRGRRGNVWVSEPGNLYGSLLLTNAAPPAHLPELCFVAALALLDAVAQTAPSLSSYPPLKGEGRTAEGGSGRGQLAGALTPTRLTSFADLPLSGGGDTEPAARLQLKWPNDLLLDGAKVAGILIEAESVGGNTATVVGIGVNCAHHPADTAHPSTDLAAAGVSAMPQTLFHPLSGAMVARLAQWDRGAGFSTIRAEWLANAAGLGGDIHVRLADRELSGRFETLDSAGRLILRLPAGNLEAITAGEIFATARETV